MLLESPDNSSGSHGHVLVGAGLISTFESGDVSAELVPSAASLQPECVRAPPTTTFRDPGEHVRPHQGADAKGLDLVGRESPNLMDQSGAQATTAGAHRVRHEQDQQATGQGRGVRVPNVVQETPRGHEQAEGGSSRVCREGAGPHQRGQVHGGPLGDSSTAEDYGDCQARWPRSYGIRTTQSGHVPADLRDRSRVLPVDPADQPRGGQHERPTSASVCPLARAEGSGRDGTRQQEGSQVPDTKEADQGQPRQQLLRRIQFSRQLQVGEPDGCNDEHDEVDEDRAGRAEECQAGHSASEEGGQGPERQRLRGLLQGDQPLRAEHLLSIDSVEATEYEQAEVDSNNAVQGLSASQRLSQVLSLGKARSLEEKAWSIVPQLFEGLVTHGRTVLLEVACSERSLLSDQIQELCQDPSAALRCSFWNGCDLSTNSGVRLILERLDLEQPAHVWLSPPCGPYSPLQNVNARTEAQRTELALKREEAMRMYVGSCVIIHACVQRGIHVTLELSERCQAWRLPIFSSLQQKYSMCSAVSKGCRVGLRDRQGVLMQKGWRILTTHKRLSELLELPCRCPKHFKHGKCEGESASQSELHTKEYARRAAKGILQEMDFSMLQQECRHARLLPSQFGLGDVCTCSDVSLPQKPRLCHVCLSEGMEQARDDSQGCVVPEGYQDHNLREGVTSEGCVHDILMSTDTEHVTMTECEMLAKKLLSSHEYDHDQCTQLLEMVKQCPGRHSGQRHMVDGQQGRYLVFGAYSHGGMYGVTSRTHQYPNLVRYLMAYMKHWNGKAFPATSLVLNLNCPVPIRRDIHNLEGFPNYVVGLGKYQGGKLWIGQTPTLSKDPQEKENACSQALGTGELVPGRTQDIWQQVIAFPPKVWHKPLEWTGNRMTVNTFVTRGLRHLNKGQREFLQGLGFHLPVEGQEQGLALSEARLGPRRPQVDKELLKRQIYQLHAATGHGSIASLVNLLRKRNVDPEVIKVAQEFKCSVCAEKKKVQPRHLASLEPLPPKFHTISTDIGHWSHPVTNEQVQFMLIIDEGSRLRVAKVLSQGSRQQPNAATCLQYLREGWSQYFGMPRALRLDPAGAFRSQQVVDFCDQEGIFLDNAPADAHWQIGVCEQAIKGVKEVMTKMCMTMEDLTATSALAAAVSVFNSRDQVRGFSPLQHVFGRSPDSTGRFLSGLERFPEELVVESATTELEKAAQLRSEAEKAHSEWHAAQRISRALNSRPRPPFNFRPGDLVFFWRSQEAGQSRRSPGSKHGRFLGPARVLATETRQDPDDQVRPAGTVWCVRGRNLIKCCPEQLRHASEREELLESLARDQGADSTPWTYTRVASEIGGSQYQDITSEVPSEHEWHRAQDPTEEAPPVRFRFRGKRAAPEPVEELPEPPESEPATSSRLPRAAMLVQPSSPWGQESGERWYECVPENAWTATEACYWNDQQAAVEVEIEMPESRKGWEQALNSLEAYFTGALKRRAVEVSEKKLTAQELAQFREAKNIEVKNFLGAQAFEVLPPHLQPSQDQAIRMRWLLSWKIKDDGTTKAKARAILLGYQDESYEHRATTAPVMSRQTRQLFLQLAACKGWKVAKGDVTGAFLQGKELSDQLYCVPCDEICQALRVPNGTVTRLRRAAYGLVQAPLQWYITIAEFLEELGLQRLRSDPCAWAWRPDPTGPIRGLVSGHVDDFLFGGGEQDKGWQAIVAKIREKFQWGSWEYDEFVQCGVRVRQTPDGFSLSQEAYVESMPEVPLSSSRRKDRSLETTAWEKSKLRAVLGALSWHAQQVAPHISAEVSLLLSEVNTSTVQTIVQVNTLVAAVKSRRKHEMLIHSFPESVELGCFAWVDAANENRHDGGSTQGIFIGLAPVSLLQGELCQISPVAWHSHKIDRICRSPGAAETQAAVNGEDNMYYARYQWAEMLFGPGDTKDPDAMVSKVSGCVISDSRNVYDKLQTEVLVIKGAEKKANIELLSLKQAQTRTKVVVRWVHSEAQLANSLTKKNGGKELELFYRMRHTWRIVEDPLMRSTRKRKQAGVETLQSSSKVETNSNHSE